VQVPSIGRIVHVGADPAINNGGDVAPAIITRVFGEHPAGGWIVNIRVLLDGHETPWRTSVRLVEESSTDAHTCWYPPRV
jgi:hypothetical protein